jgi:hypothetical protein
VCIHIGVSSNQPLHDSRTVGKVSRPVSCRMQQRPVAVLGINPCFGEPWVGSQQPLELSEVATCAAAVAATARGSPEGSSRGIEWSPRGEAVMAAKLPAATGVILVETCTPSDISGPLRS